MPEGKRRYRLREQFERVVVVAFDQRVLGCDKLAARIYDELMGDRKELGLPMGIPDAEITAISHLDHRAVATWNILDFENCGVGAINQLSSSLEVRMALRDAAMGAVTYRRTGGGAAA